MSLDGTGSLKRRKKSRDRVKDIKLKSNLFKLPPPINTSEIADGDLWGLDGFKKELNELDALSAKYVSVKNRRRNSSPIAAAVSATLVLSQVHSWRRSRLNAQLVTSLDQLLEKILFVEQSIRLWFEAIVMRKWSIRYEAMTLLNELDASIALHEYRLDCIDDRMDACKEIAVGLKKMCNMLAAMLLFNETITADLEKQKIRRQKAGHTPPRRSMPPVVGASVNRLVDPKQLMHLNDFAEDDHMVGYGDDMNGSSSFSDSNSDSDGDSYDSDEEQEDIEHISDIGITRIIDEGAVGDDDDEIVLIEENVQQEDEDAVVFTGYSGPAGESLNKVPSPSSLRSLVGKKSFENYQLMRQESFDNWDHVTGDKEHDELSEKLRRTIELVNRCNKLQDSIRPTRNKEMVLIAIANKTRSTLKVLYRIDITTDTSQLRRVRVVQQLCGFNPPSTIDTSDSNKSGGNTMAKDNRKFFSGGSSNESGGDVTRGAVGDVMTSRSAQKRSLRAIKDIIEHLQMLSSLETKTKDSLVRVIELKNDLEQSRTEINSHLEHPTQKSQAPSSVIYDIVLGAHSVPKPHWNHGDRAHLCRTTTLHKRIFSLQTLLESTANIRHEGAENDIVSSEEYAVDPKEGFSEKAFLREITSPFASITIQRECFDLKTVQAIVDKYTCCFDMHDPATARTSPCPIAPIAPLATCGAASPGPETLSFYIREFTVGEVSNLLAQLRAVSLRIHTKKDRFSAHWTREVPPWEDMDNSRSGGADDGRRSDFEAILDQLASVFSLGASFSDPQAEKERQEKASSTLAGLMWDEKTLMVQFHGIDSEEGRFLPVGLVGAVAVVAFEETYDSVLSAMSLRDYISTELGSHLPLMVYVSQRKTFMGIHPHVQQRLLTDFLHVCRPTACFCDEPCASPALSPHLPEKMCLNLRYYNHTYDKQVTARMQGAWKCHGSVLADVYPPLETTHAVAYDASDVTNNIFFGLSEAVYSLNITGARDIVMTTTPILLDAPNWSVGNAATSTSNDRSDILKDEDDLYALEGVINYSSSITAAVDSFVDSIHSILMKYESPAVHGLLPHGELLVPLGAVKVIQDAASRRTNDRVEEACAALAKWIDLSSSVAFRMRSILPTATMADMSNNPSEYDNDIVDGTIDNSSLSVSVRIKGGGSSGRAGCVRRKSSEMSVPHKKKSLEAVMQRRIPILGSVTVSCRTALYHDLLSAQISATDGRFFSNVIFDTPNSRSSFRESTSYDLTANEHLHLLMQLCKLVLDAYAQKEHDHGSKMSATLQSMKYDLRFHVLQYVLGLDERWSFEQTVSLCEFVKDCIGKHMHDDIPPQLESLLDRPGDVFGPFLFTGHRRSKLLSESTMNVLARGMPHNLYGLNCTVRYSLVDDGATLLSLFHASERQPYEACLLVVEDAVGYVFGGFLNERLRRGRDFFGSAECFVFTAMPSIKLYSSTGRNQFYTFFGSENIGFGGGGGGFAFMLDEDLSQGTSNSSETYVNSHLSFTEHFSCKQFELWTFEKPEG